MDITCINWTLFLPITLLCPETSFAVALRHQSAIGQTYLPTKHGNISENILGIPAKLKYSEFQQFIQHDNEVCNFGSRHEISINMTILQLPINKQISIRMVVPYLIAELAVHLHRLVHLHLHLRKSLHRALGNPLGMGTGCT
jgi:hypothetical protein